MGVYGLLIHSVESSQSLFFSTFYTPEGNDLSKNLRQQTIMRKVFSEYLFKAKCDLEIKQGALATRASPVAAMVSSANGLSQQNDVLSSREVPAGGTAIDRGNRSVSDSCGTNDQASESCGPFNGLDTKGSRTAGPQCAQAASYSKLEGNYHDCELNYEEYYLRRNNATERRKSSNSRADGATASKGGFVGRREWDDWRNLSDITAKAKGAVRDGSGTFSRTGTGGRGRDILGNIGGGVGGVDWGFSRFYYGAVSSKETAAANSEVSEGVVRIGGELFSCSKMAVWKEVEGIAYTLVVETIDNLILASNFLTLFVHVLSELFREQETEVGSSGGKAGTKMAENTRKAGDNAGKKGTVGLGNLYRSRADKILVVLHYLLPAGQLVFTNMSQATYCKSLIRDCLAQK